MRFTDINYLAVIVAAIVGFAVGAVWYSFLFSRPWRNAVGIGEVGMGRRSPLPFVVSIVALCVMAWVLAVFIGSVWQDSFGFAEGLSAGFLAWLGFTLTTTAVNYAFPGRPPALTAIDSGHWLVVLVVMGAIIGTFG